MSHLVRAALVAASTVLVLGLGAVGVAAPAQADTSWGCGGCQPAR